jgi:hypothetical protein
MTNALVTVVVWLNGAANALGEWVLLPIALMPGWLSATLIAAVTGIVLLVIFKYTSNQRAIQRVRNRIDANLLALKLFKESSRVTIEAQGRLLAGAGKLFALALVPTAVMIVPVTLILGQLSLWYQQRPLEVGEEAVITLALAGDADAAFPDLKLEPTDAIETTLGPVRVLSKREVCWNIKAKDRGYHPLVFHVGDAAVTKELAVGEGFMRVSARRPGWDWADVLLYPAESPFTPDSPVRSIDVSYPARRSWTSGTDRWVIYWFVVSLVAAFCLRGALRVNT